MKAVTAKYYKYMLHIRVWSVNVHNNQAQTLDYVKLKNMP